MPEGLAGVTAGAGAGAGAAAAPRAAGAAVTGAADTATIGIAAACRKPEGRVDTAGYPAAFKNCVHSASE